MNPKKKLLALPGPVKASVAYGADDIGRVAHWWLPAAILVRSGVWIRWSIAVAGCWKWETEN